MVIYATTNQPLKFVTLNVERSTPLRVHKKDTPNHPNQSKNIHRAGQAGGGSFKENNYKSKKDFAYRMCTR